MHAESLKCEGCGAAIELPASGRVAKCPYCQTERMVPADASDPLRPENIVVAMTTARETMDKMLGSAFPGARIVRAVLPIVVMVIFAMVALKIFRRLF